MKKQFLLLLGAGLLAFASCNKKEKTETVETTTVTEKTEPTTDNEAMYRERASEVANQMAQDLKLDTDTVIHRKVTTVYYTRAKRRHEARGKYTTDTTGMYMTMRDIDLETDQEFKKMLKPEQYEVYEARRTTYYGGFEETERHPDSMGSTTMAPASESPSSTAKVRTKTEKDGDSKTEIEDGDSQTKIKTDHDGTTKIKTKDGKSKTKSKDH
jgi:hypothetical protein